MTPTPSTLTPSPLSQVKTARPVDAARVLGGVLLPVVARGAVVRRPRAVALAERLDLDARAVRTLVRLRDRYGSGPLQVRAPRRRLVLVLDPDDARRVLDETPVPFRADTREKRAALERFQPEGVLVSPPAARPPRRALNEVVLDTGREHREAPRFVQVVQEELPAGQTPLDWDAFAPAWWRIVRRVVLGDAARDETEVTDLLLRLRRSANWSLLGRRHRRTRRAFLEALERSVGRAEPGSLAAHLAATPAEPGAAPLQQVPQWLFAFDAGAWATFRALALACSEPGALARVRSDPAYARACVLESLRLWPTTPAVLRDTCAPTTWRTGTLPAGASVLVFTPYFHRDQTRLPQAHRFAPELWDDEVAERQQPLLPFSAGPAACPGRDVVLLVATAALQALAASDVERVGGPLPTPLPAPLDPFRLRFRT